MYYLKLKLIFIFWETRWFPPPTDKHPTSTVHCTDTKMQIQYKSKMITTISDAYTILVQMNLAWKRKLKQYEVLL